MTTLIRDDSTQTGSTFAYVNAVSEAHRVTLPSETVNGVNVLDYRMGSGNDTFAIYSAALGQEGNSLKVDAGEGSDYLTANLSTARSALTVTNGSVIGSGVNLTGFERYNLTLSAYDDLIDLSGVQWQGDLNGGLGRDSLIINNSALTAGSGYSITAFTDSAGQAWGVYGLFNSWGFLSGFESIDISMGKGEDYLRFDYVATSASSLTLEFNGGAGVDQLTLVWTSVEVSNLVLSNTTFVLGNTTFTGFEAFVIQAGTGNDRITTGDGNDSLDGGAGNDTLNGGSGDDVLGSAHAGWGSDFGADVMRGGFGNDTYYVDDLADRVIELSGQGTDIVVSQVSFDLSDKPIENLTLWGGASGTGNSLANRLVGNGVANTLTGLAGHDYLDGGYGADTLIGGTGNDTYVLNEPSDVVVENAGEGRDTIVAAFSYSLKANLENLTLTGYDLTGNGTAAGNVMTSSGENTLSGGKGNDTYYIGLNDNVVERNDEGIDTVYSDWSYSLAGRYVETLILTGDYEVNATGNSFVNTLAGNDSNNLLNGKGGNDLLTGGLGADTFLFQTGCARDVVTDFAASQDDKIDIHAFTGGTANQGMVAQVANDVVISLGGSNSVTVLNAIRADVLSHIVW